MANVISEIEVLDKYLPSIIAVLTGSATETVTTPAESYTFKAGSFGEISIAVPPVPITITKTA
jgi:hypothetical protein